MNKKERPLVDTKCFSLAADFLSEIPGATEDDTWALAAAFQREAEDACREVEGRAADPEIGEQLPL